jgi:hypothetical protein
LLGKAILYFFLSESLNIGGDEARAFHSGAVAKPCGFATLPENKGNEKYGICM